MSPSGPDSRHPPDAAHPPSSRFATTRWSLVVDAGTRGTPAAREALGDLAQQYWYPLYAFARRRGASPEDAQDWTQGFLADLLERPEFFAGADPRRGRFRAFLIHTFKHYVGRQKERAAAARRGGGRRQLPLSIDFDDGERRYGVEPVDDVTAERLFERRWALSVLTAALARLGEHYESRGKGEFYRACRGCLTAQGGQEPQAELAARLEMSPANLRTALHRMRARYREMLREEVGRTVVDESDVDGELAVLREALR